MSYGTTIRTVVAASSEPLTLKIAEHRFGPATATVFLFIGRNHRGPFAVVFAEHVDPEGTFMEIVKARGLVDRVGEYNLSSALAEIRFESGISAAVTLWDDFARLAPDLLAP